MVSGDLHNCADGRTSISADRWHELLDALPAAIYTTDAQGRLTHFNRACVEFSGRMPELGTDHRCVTWKLFHPDGRPMRHDECPMAIALKEGRVIRGAEAIAERPDGTRIWFAPYPTPLFDKAGNVVGGINMLVDITERKKAEKDNAHLAAVVESSDDAIATKDLSGIIRSWNAGAERLFGYTAQEAIGQPVTMLMPPDRINEEPEILERIRRGDRIDHYETVRRRKDGSLVDISLTISPVKDAQGRVIGASKVARDITEQKSAEQALRQSEERFRMFADNIGPLAWTCDELGRANWYNKRWLDYTGLTFEEMKESGWTRCHHPDHLDRVLAGVARARESGEPWEDTFPLRGRDGQYRWFLSRAYPIRDERGNVVRWFGTNTDITAQREAEAALRRHKDELEQIVSRRTAEVTAAVQRMAMSQRMAAVGTLAAGLAHDMNNLLMPLGLRLDALRSGKPLRPGQTPPVIHDDVRGELLVISALYDHLRDLSQNLSLFARDPEKEGIVGRTTIVQWAASVHKLLDASVGREIVVKWDCPAPGISLPDAAIAPHRLTQAVQNLMHNARDAVLAAKAADPARIPHIAVRAELARQNPSFIALSVSDNGVGMDAETQRRAIEPFFTTRDRPDSLGSHVPIDSALLSRRGAGGTGLGLSLAHQIAERAGGSLETESNPGQGTTITLLLPVAAISEGQARS